MSESTLDQPGTETEPDAPTIDKPDEQDENSVRALLEAQLSDSTESPADTPDSKPDDDPDADKADVPIVADEPPKAPQSWTEAEREAWAELPEVARDAISRREGEYQAGLKSDAELQKVIAPLADGLKGTGVHADQYIQGLITGDKYIRTNPLDAVLEIVQRHGLSDQLTARLSETPPPTLSNADDSGSAQKIADLEQRIAYNAAVSDYSRQWDAFVIEHPDAKDLREVIAAKVGANPNLEYSEAYKQAKELVSSINGEAAKSTEAKTVKASTKASTKAAKLSLPRGKSDSGTAPASTGNLREDIETAMRDMGYRAT